MITTRPTTGSIDRDQLFDFVSARLAEALQSAVSTGDEPRAEFVAWTIGVVQDMRADLETDPRRAPEVTRYLQRVASAYGGHRDFRSHWHLG